MKKVYCYDYEGKLIGSVEADECQITNLKIKEQTARGLKEGEEEIQPVYILPADSTDIEPPSKLEDGFQWKFINGDWYASEIPKPAEVEEQEKEPELTYAQKRQREYPSCYDYLDGIVKGDTKQVQKYIDDCLAVKAKYPKPKK